MNSSSIDWALLKGVSRSFYLTLRILPAPVRESIALAYLAARVSDTLADGATSAAERRLLERQGEIERWIADSPDRREIESVWATIREGQDFDRSRFSHSGAIPLSDEELDRYTYLVAGCVGAFWTKLCAKKMPGFSSRDHRDDDFFGHSLWQRPPTCEHPSRPQRRFRQGANLRAVRTVQRGSRRGAGPPVVSPGLCPRVEKLSSACGMRPSPVPCP